jgi:hypothetical protein
MEGRSTLAANTVGRCFADHKSAAEFLIDWLEKQNHFELVRAGEHRVLFRPPDDIGLTLAGVVLALSRIAGGGYGLTIPK